MIENYQLSYREYYTIIITNVDAAIQNVSYGIIQKIFYDFWGNGINNVYVLTNNSLYTLHPYDESCNKTAPAIVKHDGYSTSKFDLFVDKQENMHKCNIIVMTSVYTPYIIYETDRNDSEFLSGIEGEMIKQLGKMLNFTVVVRPVPGAGFRVTMNDMVVFFIFRFCAFTLLNVIFPYIFQALERIS